MFHLQVGSHEDEPVVLARHIAATGAARVALVYDRSPIGRRYAAYFETEAERLGLEIGARRSVPPVLDDGTADIAAVHATSPMRSCTSGSVSADAPSAGRAPPRVGPRRRTWARAGMWGHTPGIAADIDGWTYVDVYSDANSVLAGVRARLPEVFARGPAAAYGYDLGLLVAEGLARATELTRHGVREGLEAVKWVPAAEGEEGTHLTFGPHDRGALHGRYLVMRRWEAGVSIEVVAGATAR